jgi:ABC-type antimicrobial peptide transport system permease subunit
LSKLAGASANASELVIMLIQVAALMAVVGVLASIGPARRALRVQPTEALKGE